MKHIYFALGVSLLAGSAWGQRLTERHDFARRPAPLTSIDLPLRTEPAVSAYDQVAERGGTILFAENFANGFAGNNGFGPWTAEDTGNGLIWQWVDAAGDGHYADGTASGVEPPAGEFSTNIPSLNSSSDLDGWMIFDCDYFNTPISDGFENTEGSLTSPTMDLSSAASVVVTWEQYFRYCCFPYAPIFLEVSGDGGLTWTTFEGHGTFIESANTASANPLTTSVDVSCVAAGSSQVQIRFSYLQAPETGDGYSHYYWGLDDVVVSQNPVANDLSVVQVTNGDVYNIFEYRVTPLEQAISAADGGLLAGVLYRNSGNANQDETTITVEILDGTGAVLSTTVAELGTVASFANAAACPSNPQDTLYIETGWVPTAEGEYLLRATIASANADETPNDNVLEKSIVYSSDEYGHDDETALDVEFRPQDSDVAGLFNPCGYGNYYTMANEGSTAYGMTVRFGPNSGGGDIEFETRLYTLDPAVGLTDSPFESTFWQYDDAWTPNSVATSEYVYLPFEDPIELTTDFFYFGGVIVEFENAAELTVLGNANSDTDNSTGSYEQAGSGDFVWFTSQTATPAVRLILSQRVAVDEIAGMNGMLLHQNVPNPTDGTTTIRFELAQPRTVALELRDLQGRLIQSIEAGRLPAGEHSSTFDVSGLQAGIYSYTLVADGMRMTKKLVVR